MRSGTLNVPGIVGLGAACEIAMNEMEAEAKRELELRDYLKKKFEDALDYVHVNGNMDHHLPGNLNMSFVYVEGEILLMGINDIAVSSGSACTSATLEPSYVLKALGLGDDVAHSSIRFGLGRFNNKAEVDYVSDKIIDVVRSCASSRRSTRWSRKASTSPRSSGLLTKAGSRYPSQRRGYGPRLFLLRGLSVGSTASCITAFAPPHPRPEC